MKKLGILILTLVLIFSIGNLALAVDNTVDVNVSIGEKILATSADALALPIIWDDTTSQYEFDTGDSNFNNTVSFELITNTAAQISSISADGFSGANDDLNSWLTYTIAYDSDEDGNYDDGSTTFNPGDSGVSSTISFSSVGRHQLQVSAVLDASDGAVEDLDADVNINTKTITITFAAATP